MKWFRRKYEPVKVDIRPAAISPSFDPNSETWLFIADWAAKRIAELREQNDKPLDADKTAAIRGQIKLAKQLLDLPKPGPDNNRPKSFAASIFGAEREDDE